MSRLLEQDLVAAGYSVIRVPTRLMARTRAWARTVGKSDPIDALAIARAALREPNLPTADIDRTSRELKLRVDRRENLIAQRNATMCRLLWRVHELDPERIIKSSALSTRRIHRDITAEWLKDRQGLVAELARDELADIGRQSPGCAAARVKNPRTRPTSRPRTSWPVASCGPLSAAEIVAETAGVQRFPTEAAFARFAGVAPSPVWSGATQGRWRYIKTGNRQINAALRSPRNKGAMVLTAGWHLQMTHTVHSDIRVSVGLETWCRCGGKVCRAAGGRPGGPVSYSAGSGLASVRGFSSVF